MQENFDKALEMLLHHEGGYVNHPRDPGGETNLGVTRNTYSSWVGRSVEDGDLPPGLDFFCFDWGVNSGVSRSAKALQGIIGVEQDGGIGPQTLKALAEYDTAEVLIKMHDKRQGFYEGLKTFDTFGKGWTRRNKEALEQAQQLAD